MSDISHTLHVNLLEIAGVGHFTLFGGHAAKGNNQDRQDQ
jgi:hypothetical protein